jgi:hypothetical protein
LFCFSIIVLAIWCPLLVSIAQFLGYFVIFRSLGAGGVAQVLEFLPSMHEALDLISSRERRYLKRAGGVAQADIVLVFDSTGV